MKVLLVEDDIKTASFIIKGLKQDGFTVEHADDGPGGLFKAATEKYDVAIVDVMLPGLDGLTLIKELRRKKIMTPIIVLSAKASVEDRVAGLQHGGDDYLVKPFSLPELHARVEAVLRRGQSGLQNILEIGDLSYDMNSLEVVRQGKPIKLSPIGLKLLEKLMKSSPHVVRREVLEELLWGEALPGSDSLRSHIHTLRQAIDKPFDPPLLHTVHGIGFCLKVQTDEI